MALIEPLDSARRIWLVEFTTPDESLVGGVRYDVAELPLDDLDFTEELEHDMGEADAMAARAVDSSPYEDVAVAMGGCKMPRKWRAT